MGEASQLLVPTCPKFAAAILEGRHIPRSLAEGLEAAAGQVFGAAEAPAEEEAAVYSAAGEGYTAVVVRPYQRKLLTGLETCPSPISHSIDGANSRCETRGNFLLAGSSESQMRDYRPADWMGG